MTDITSATFEGAPYDRGIAHGEAFADEVAHNAAFYLDHFAEHGVAEPAAREHARAFVERIPGYHDTYLTEMRGVAEGSGVPLEEVTLINVRQTILYSAYASEGTEEDARAPTPEGCTSFGLEPEVTATGRVYLGQNFDWQAPVEMLVMDVRRDDGPDFVAVTEAGNVGGKFGVNEHGIGVVANGLSTPADGDHPYRKPSHVRGREIFDAERLDEAIGAIIGTPRPTSRNYLVGHAAGEVIDVETAPDTVGYVYPDDGVVTHANHFGTPGIESIYERRLPDSVSRGRRIERLFARPGDIDEGAMKAVLRDHAGRPRSICRHGDGSGLHTNASGVIDLNERRLLAAGGPPCEGEYHEFSVGA